jgi:hypothetical protein
LLAHAHANIVAIHEVERLEERLLICKGPTVATSQDQKEAHYIQLHVQARCNTRTESEDGLVWAYSQEEGLARGRQHSCRSLVCATVRARHSRLQRRREHGDLDGAARGGIGLEEAATRLLVSH